jgi:hypothetical protein
VVSLDRDLQAAVSPPAQVQTVEVRRVAEPLPNGSDGCHRRGEPANEGEV